MPLGEIKSVLICLGIGEAPHGELPEQSDGFRMGNGAQYVATNSSGDATLFSCQSEPSFFGNGPQAKAAWLPFDQS